VAVEDRVAQIESVIREWLEEPAITVVCGDWQSGSIMELLPEGRAVLTRQRYPEPFSGLRDLHLVGQGHHLHLDLAKLPLAVYSVSPCVCYGYRPSFDVRFTDGRDDGRSCAFALSVREPYRGDSVNRAALVPYFRRMLDHQARFPEVVRLRVDAPREGSFRGWDDAFSCLLEAGAEPRPRAAARARETCDV